LNGALKGALRFGDIPNGYGTACGLLQRFATESPGGGSKTTSQTKKPHAPFIERDPAEKPFHIAGEYDMEIIANRARTVLKSSAWIILRGFANNTAIKHKRPLVFKIPGR
jgi:hypothetical protein